MTRRAAAVRQIGVRTVDHEKIGKFRSSSGDAAWIAGLIGFTAIFGLLATGSLQDRMDGWIIAAACVSLPIAAILILVAFRGSISAAAFALLIFGFSHGAKPDIVAYLTSRYFERENFGFLLGKIGGCLGSSAQMALWHSMQSTMRPATIHRHCGQRSRCACFLQLCSCASVGIPMRVSRKQAQPECR
jgi:MFS family permease